MPDPVISLKPRHSGASFRRKPERNLRRQLGPVPALLVGHFVMSGYCRKDHDGRTNTDHKIGCP